MVTLASLRAAFAAIVGRNNQGVSFSSEWTTVLDTNLHARQYPVCLWGPPDSLFVTPSTGRLTEVFMVDCLFLQETLPGRTSAQRDTVVSDMHVIARDCFLLFWEENVKESTTMDLRLIEGARFTAVYDRAGDACSGVRLEFRVASNEQPVCVGGNFSVS